MAKEKEGKRGVKYDVDQKTPQTKNRKSNKEKQEDSKRESKRICLPIDQESYNQIIADKELFRSYVDECIEKHPELFPKSIKQGYKLNGFCDESKKMPEVSIRRIKVTHTKECYQIVPSYVMPYMTGYTEEIEKALFLHFKHEVAYSGLVYAFGKDEMYWFRMSQQFGRSSIVGTTTKDPKKLPKDIVVDEKHTKSNGEKVYVATTVGEECFWGASVSSTVEEQELTKAYKHFKEEAQAVDSKYEPETVNTDGFSSTLKVWSRLFAKAVLIRCFLHGFLKIRSSTRKLNVFSELSKLVWEAYHQVNYEGFINKMTVLWLWAQHNSKLLGERTVESVKKLCGRAHEYAKAYNHPTCKRTSNMLDRLMQRMDRYLFMNKYFHGHLHTAELGIRAWVLAHNFLPYTPRAGPSKNFISPVHRLNGKLYHHNWLENLLVSSSLGGKVD